MTITPVSQDLSQERKRIVDAFLELAATRGCTELDAGVLATKADVSVATLRNLFPDHLARAAAAYDEVHRILFDGVLTAVDRSRGDHWSRRLVAGLEAFVQGVMAAPELARTFVYDYPSLGPAAERHVRTVKARWGRFLADEVDETIATDPSVAPFAVRPGHGVVTAFVGGLYDLCQLVLDPTEPFGEEDFVFDATTLFLGAHDRGLTWFAGNLVDLAGDPTMPATELGGHVDAMLVGLRARVAFAQEDPSA